MAWVLAAGAITYFAALWLMGFRLRDFNRHEPA
jgi:putative peptidoglycan lipid II flippase